MLSEFFASHGLETIPVVIFLLTLSAIITSRKKHRKERPDPPVLFGPIRGLYVCYQCDTIFNTTRCPGCQEDAVIPLIQLTGSIVEDDGVADVIRRLQRLGEWKLPDLQTLQIGQAVTPALKPGRKSSNGKASEVPLTISDLISEGDRIME
jgi:hypothetical protein